VFDLIDRLPVAVENVSLNPKWREQHQFQCDLLRDLLGDPFHAVAFDPAWRTPAVVSLAKGIYEGRHFSDLPLLADALEEAEFGDDELLWHLRSGVEHFRGCWALDLVLKKK